MTDLTIRSLQPDDMAAVAKLLADAFLTDDVEGVAAREALVVDPARGHGVFDGGQVIGTGTILTRRMVLPGTGLVPVAAVTSVGVAPGHRRRGALSMVIRAQLTQLHESGGEPIAALWASESSIYGRFGYGMASEVSNLVLPAKTRFRDGVDLGTERVLEQPRETAIPLVRKLYEQISVERAGALDRDDGAWELYLYDSERDRNGRTAYRFAMHRDGYAVFRMRAEWRDEGPRGELMVHELMASTPQAYAALTRYVLDMDLIGTVSMRGSVQEPLTYLLADPRVVHRSVSDSLWVRIVDVPRALPLRTYAAPADVVLGVVDTFCPWNDGTWRLRIGADGVAEVTRSDDAPDLLMAVDDLGAILLGGTRASTLALAGRIKEQRAGSLATLSHALHTDAPPVCVEIF